MITQPQKNALLAVAAGMVRHAHPYSWGPLNPRISWRTLQSLANRKLIRVEANNKDYWRPVTLTDAGRAALNSVGK
jgi:hypothetical protein